MAVTVGTELVNNGNSGWTNADVMTALEKVFYEMGYNSGSQEDGVPIAVLYPGYNTSLASSFTGCIRYHYETTPTAAGDSRFAHCGGTAPTALTTNPTRYRRFYVTNSGTSSWQISEELKPTSTGSNNEIDINGSMGQNFTTGTKLTYNGTGTQVINGLSSGNVYYMRRVDNNTITLHNSASDANNNAAVVTTSYTSMSDPKSFRTDAQTNPTITIGKGDNTYWHTSDHTAGGEFRLFDATTGLTYAANRSFHVSDNISTGQSVSGSGTYASPYSWDTEYYWQTETEFSDETQISGTSNQGQHAYGYASDTHSTMKGTIIINAQLDNSSYDNRTYWKYTVPALSLIHI